MVAQIRRHKHPQAPRHQQNQNEKKFRPFRIGRLVPKGTIASAEKTMARMREKLRLYNDLIDSIQRSGQRELAHDLGNFFATVDLNLMLGEDRLATAREGRVEEYKTGFENIRKAQAYMRFMETILLRHSENVSFLPKPIRFQKLAGILKETAELAAPGLVKLGKLDFKLAKEGREKKAVVDAFELQRAIYNLADNANAAVSGGRKGQVRISMELRGDRLSIVVADTGAGMPEEMVRKFYTGEMVRGDHYGLVSARKSIEAHGGTIKLESREGRAQLSRFPFQSGNEWLRVQRFLWNTPLCAISLFFTKSNFIM